MSLRCDALLVPGAAPSDLAPEMLTTPPCTAASSASWNFWLGSESSPSPAALPLLLLLLLPLESGPSPRLSTTGADTVEAASLPLGAPVRPAADSWTSSPDSVASLPCSPSESLLSSPDD